MNILSNLLINIKPEITDVILRNTLLEYYESDESDNNSYKQQNKILGDIYNSHNDFISEINKRDYNLSIIDYQYLSDNLKVGFILFTNRYSNNSDNFKTYIIIHKNLLTDLNIPTICLYQDFSDVNNKECKPIVINDNLIQDLQQLLKNNTMNRIFKKTYKI